jgi:uncharacterized protein YcbX
MVRRSGIRAGRSHRALPWYGGGSVDRGTVRVGTVAALYRFLVKSMRGEMVLSAQLYWHGLAGDRRYAFVREGNASRFPWLTGREVPDLLRYAPYLAADDEPMNDPVRVRTPAGADLAIGDALLRDELAGRYGAGVTLLQNSRGVPDSAALSLLGVATVRELGARIGTPLDPLRFRNNVLIATIDDCPFEEEGWLDGVIRFGEEPAGPRVHVNRKDPRCMMVNLDPDEVTQNPAVLRTIVRERERCAGLYASVEGIGMIGVGDPVYLSRR